MSDTAELVRKANQIASFFAAYPEDEAVAGVGQHIKDFWTRDMRDRMAAHVNAGGEGLKPLAVRALASYG